MIHVKATVDKLFGHCPGVFVREQLKQQIISIVNTAPQKRTKQIEALKKHKPSLWRIRYATSNKIVDIQKE